MAQPAENSEWKKRTGGIGTDRSHVDEATVTAMSA